MSLARLLLNADFLERCKSSISTVTKAEVLAGVERRFHPDQLVSALGTIGLPLTSLDLTIGELSPVVSQAHDGSLQRGRCCRTWLETPSAVVRNWNAPTISRGSRHCGWVLLLAEAV
jgi:hypothetical protein